jgi:hypothetical protein
MPLPNGMPNHAGFPEPSAPRMALVTPGIEVSDLKACRFTQVFNFAVLGHVSGRFAYLRTVGAEFAWRAGADLMALGLSAAGSAKTTHRREMIT